MTLRALPILLAVTAGCAGGGAAVPIGWLHVGGSPAHPTFCSLEASPDSTVYDTTQVTQRPVVYDAPTLRYPAAARAQGIQGRVMLAVTINADGRADARSIETLSSPDLRLADAAERWVRGAKFVPACLDGRPIRLRVAIPVDFTLGS